MVKSDRESNLKEQIYTFSWGLSLPRAGKHGLEISPAALLGSVAPQSPDVALMDDEKVFLYMFQMSSCNYYSYKCELKYLSPRSGKITTIFPLAPFFISCIAAANAAPEDEPAKMPSQAAKRCTQENASVSGTFIA